MGVGPVFWGGIHHCRRPVVVGFARGCWPCASRHYWRLCVSVLCVG